MLGGGFLQQGVEGSMGIGEAQRDFRVIVLDPWTKLGSVRHTSAGVKCHCISSLCGQCKERSSFIIVQNVMDSQVSILADPVKPSNSREMLTHEKFYRRNILLRALFIKVFSSAIFQRDIDYK
jgi:hypothetical protein